MSTQTVGILAVQGAFIEHKQMLEGLGAHCIELRQASDLDQHFDRLVLPGGESTTQGKLLADLDMLEPLRKRIADGLPTLATCAGLILLAERLDAHDDKGTPRLKTLDITAKRNAYGRQLGSFHTNAVFEGLGEIPMTFIRAPFVAEVGPATRVLAEVDDNVVAVRQNNQLAVAFHPELDSDTRIHELFLEI